MDSELRKILKKRFELINTDQKLAQKEEKGFGRYLRACRLNKELTIAELSLNTGLCERVISRLEHGIYPKIQINTQWLDLLATELDENPDNFFLLLGYSTNKQLDTNNSALATGANNYWGKPKISQSDERESIAYWGAGIKSCQRRYRAESSNKDAERLYMDK